MKKYFLALSLFCFSSLVFAETTPAAYGTGPVPPEFWWGGACGVSTVSVVEVCRAQFACGGSYSPINVRVLDGLCTSDTSATDSTPISYGTVWAECPAGATAVRSTATCIGPSYSCPQDQNWTLVGTTCTRPDCVLNETRSPATGVCMSSCIAGIDNKYGKSYVVNATSFPSSVCVDNCTYGVGAGVGDGTPGWRVYLTQNKGTACATGEASGTLINDVAVDDPLGAPPPCSTGETRVTYSFGFVCVPNDVLASGDLPASAVPGTGPGQPAGTTPGATVSETSGTSTTTTNPDGSTTTISSSSTVAPDMSKPIVDKLQELFGGDSEPVADDVPLGTKSIAVSITPVTVSGSGSCPAPSPFVLHGQTYYFQWATYCNFASGIKPILLAFAWLSAAGILVGGFKA